MTYPETIQYLESFINYEKVSLWSYKESLKLERMRDFLTEIGHPQATLRCIHVAGTKGKGSTCAFTAYILREAGFKVGLYTSPHLLDFRERIRILSYRNSVSQSTSEPVNELDPLTSSPVHPHTEFEGMISKNELIELVEKLKPAIEKYNKISKYGPLSFFEVYTTLAFVYFKEKGVDFAVLETGLGGRLDATNVVNPYLCAITPISYEHTQKLGHTLKEIAQEKVGIIKVSQLASEPVSQFNRQTGKPTNRQTLIVISAPQEKEVCQIIRTSCQDVGARLYEVNKDIFYEGENERFNVLGIFGEYPLLKIKLLGRHQLINATVGVGIVEGLRFYGINIDNRSIRDGLYNTLWPGRCEVVSKSPLVILDGAQNVASASVLKETIKENFRYRKLILVLGISKDKDIRGICNELNELGDEVILTKADNPRATEPETLANYFNGKKVFITHSLKEAKIKVDDIAKKEDLIVVTGSLFVVGEFRGSYI